MNQHDPHRWKTPTTPRGMLPSAWPESRRLQWVEAIQRGDRDAPRPHHEPGSCDECDRMREILREQAPQPAGPALAVADGPSGGFNPLAYVGRIRAYPGALAVVLGMMAGALVCAVVGLVISLALAAAVMAWAIWSVN